MPVLHRPLARPQFVWFCFSVFFLLSSPFFPFPGCFLSQTYTILCPLWSARGHIKVSRVFDILSFFSFSLKTHSTSSFLKATNTHKHKLSVVSCNLRSSGEIRGGCGSAEGWYSFSSCLPVCLSPTSSHKYPQHQPWECSIKYEISLKGIIRTLTSYLWQ